jgi:hypothetical protein
MSIDEILVLADDAMDDCIVEINSNLYEEEGSLLDLI